MKNSLVSLFVVLTLVLASFSFKLDEEIPNPEDYTKLFLEVIRKNDRQLYLNTFSVNKDDIGWMYMGLANNPFSTPEDKQYLNLKLTDSSEFIRNTNNELNEGYDNLVNWKETNQIELSQVEYLTVDYEIAHDPKKPFYLCEDLNIYVKYQDKYFRIAIDEAIYLNGKWRHGKIVDISESDQYLMRIKKYDSEEAYDVDSMVAYADTGSVYADTAAVAPAGYDGYSREMTKKQQKIQNKIDALHKKEYELYEELDSTY